MNRSRAKVISSISTSIGQVFFAAFVGAIAIPLDSDKATVVILYLLLAVLFWFLAIIFGEKGKI